MGRFSWRVPEPVGGGWHAPAESLSPVRAEHDRVRVQHAVPPPVDELTVLDTPSQIWKALDKTRADSYPLTVRMVPGGVRLHQDDLLIQEALDLNSAGLKVLNSVRTPTANPALSNAPHRLRTYWKSGRPSSADASVPWELSLKLGRSRRCG